VRLLHRNTIGIKFSWLTAGAATAARRRNATVRVVVALMQRQPSIREKSATL